MWEGVNFTGFYEQWSFNLFIFWSPFLQEEDPVVTSFTLSPDDQVNFSFHQIHTFDKNIEKHFASFLLYFRGQKENLHFLVLVS